MYFSISLIVKYTIASNFLISCHDTIQHLTNDIIMSYHIHGLFGGDFNLAVWQIFIGSPNLNHAVLPRTHEMN